MKKPYSQQSYGGDIMDLSNDLISKFVELSNENRKVKKETTLYGTIKIQNGLIYVHLDGSTSLTPVQTTTFVSDGDRVTVMIKDHQAIITGNVTFPSIREPELEKAMDEIRFEFTEMHNNGYEQGITTINKDGITVSHTAIKTKSKMAADGFCIVDSSTGEDEVIAWLSSKSQWTELSVDKVFANNIASIYDGPGTLYINHSYNGDSDGSVDKPFSSFVDLKKYLEATPMINKDLTINILNPGFEITEQLSLHGLFGSGWISIRYDSKVVHRVRGEGQYGILLSQIQKYVWVHGGRSSHDATDGALITDMGEDSAHGIFVSDVFRIYIGFITINCKNWGLVCERTHCFNYDIDFGQCWNAVELRDSSIYYQYDCCGGNVDFCRVKDGSMAFWGSDSNGIRPMGIVPVSQGMYYSYGSDRIERDSYRFPKNTQAPTPPTNANHSKTFVWTSHKTYCYAYSNWSDSKCKQGSWGYGLRGGHMFFDLSDIRSFLNGTVIDGNTITLTRASNGGVSGASNVYINGSTCSGPSGTPNYSNQTHLGTLKWGETKTFTLPKSIVESLKNGTCNSLAVYVNSNNQNDYINIVNCSITLKVNK